MGTSLWIIIIIIILFLLYRIEDRDLFFSNFELVFTRRGWLKSETSRSPATS